MTEGNRLITSRSQAILDKIHLPSTLCMINIVLFEPEIPPNTGSIIRLCANTGMKLHLIEPLGFSIDDKKMRRAGLDYHEWAQVKIHANFDSFISDSEIKSLYACTTKGSKRYTDINFNPGDALLMGPETRGLPNVILEKMSPDHKIRIPMLPESRSMNLANATAVIAYEALRQLDFPGCV